MRFCLVISLVVFSSVLAWQTHANAQTDLSSEVLLSSGENAPPQEAGLQSGRYQIKPAGSGNNSSRSPQTADSEMQIRLKKNGKAPLAKAPTKLPGKKVPNKSLQDDTQMQTSVVVTPKAVPPTLPQKDSSLAQSLFSPTATPRPSIIPPPTTSTTTTSTTTSTTTMLPAVAAEARTESMEPLPPLKKIESRADSAAPAEAPAPSSSVAESTPSVTKPNVTEPAVIAEPTVFDKPAVEAYKEQIHSDDIRMNQIEIDIMPGVVNNDSRADYSFRNYSTFSPAILFGAEFWMSPFLGVYGNYMTSLGADIVSNDGQNARVPAKHEWTELGVDIRKFFGMSRRANSIEFGINYSEYKFTLPGDEPNRVRLKTAGFAFHFSTRIPTAPTYAWNFGGTIAPRLAHSEVGTGIDLQSGSSPETSRVSFDIGGEFKMARQNQVIWKFNVGFEKNQYVGPANQVDPETGITPSGVSVRNTFTGFSLGYRWGQ